MNEICDFNLSCGCCSVGRRGASDTRDPKFESIPFNGKFYLLSTVLKRQ